MDTLFVVGFLALAGLVVMLVVLRYRRDAEVMADWDTGEVVTPPGDAIKAWTISDLVPNVAPPFIPPEVPCEVCEEPVAKVAPVKPAVKVSIKKPAAKKKTASKKKPAKK